MSNEIEQVYFANHVHRILRPSDDAIGEASAHGLSLASNVQIGTVDAALKIFKLDSTGNFTTSNNFILKGINGPTVNKVRIQGQLVVESGNGLFLNGLSGIIVTSSSSDNVYLKLQRTVNTKDSLVHFIPQGTLSSSNPEFRLGIPGNSTGFSLARYDGSTSLNFVNVSALGLVTILSGTTISGNLAVSGTSTLRGNTDVLGTLSATGTSTLRGNTTVLGTLGVSGLTSLNTLTTTGVINANSLNVGGNTSLTGTLVVGSTANVTGTLSVTGTSTLRGNTTVLGTLGVSGLTSLNTLTTTGVINANSLNVGGNTSLTGTLVVGSTANVTGTLSVTGATTLRGNTTVLGTLGASGLTSLNTLTTTGVVNASSLNVGGNTSLTGTLVVGSTANVTGLLSVTGATTLRGAVNALSTLQVASDTTITGNLNVTGTSTLRGAANTLSTLQVASDTTITGNLNVTGATTLRGAANTLSTLQVASDTTITGNLNVTGATTLRGAANTLSTLQVASDTTITGNLNVTGSTTFSGLVTFKSGATVSGNLNVTGTSTLRGAANTLSDFQVAGNTTLTGTLGVTGSSNFSGIATFQSGVTISGLTSLNTLTTTGVVNASSLNVSGATTITGNLSVSGIVQLGTGYLYLPSSTAYLYGGLSVRGNWVWRQGDNFTLSADANNQEWSVDLYNQSTYTGCYWQVWSDKTSSSVLAVRGDTTSVGVRTTSPASGLDVNTDAVFRSGVTISGLSSLNTLTTTGIVNANSLNVSGDSTITGALGVSGLTSLGTSPYQSSQLTVATKLSITDTNNAFLVFNGGGLNLGIHAFSNTFKFFNPSGPITFEMGSSERMRIQTDGKVGINTNAPASGLDVNADALFRSGVTVSGNLNASIPVFIGEKNRNLLLYSQDFNQANWVKLSLSAPATAISSPDFHPSSASQYTGTSSLGGALINQEVATTAGQTYVGSIFLKGTGTGSVSLNLTNHNGITGTISTTTCNYTASWQRFSVTGTANTTGTRLYVGSDGTWANGEAIALWGAQLESGSVATRYIATATGNPISSGILTTDSSLKKTYFDGTAEVRNDGESLRLVGQTHSYMTFYATGTSASVRTGYLGFVDTSNLNEFRIQTQMQQQY